MFDVLLSPSSHHSRAPYSLEHFRALIRVLILSTISPNIPDSFHLWYSSVGSCHSCLFHSKFVIFRNRTRVLISTNLLDPQWVTGRFLRTYFDCKILHFCSHLMSNLYKSIYIEANNKLSRLHYRFYKFIL